MFRTRPALTCSSSIAHGPAQKKLNAINKSFALFHNTGDQTGVVLYNITTRQEVGNLDFSWTSGDESANFFHFNQTNFKCSQCSLDNSRWKVQTHHWLCFFNGKLHSAVSSCCIHGQMRTCTPDVYSEISSTYPKKWRPRQYREGSYQLSAPCSVCVFMCTRELITSHSFKMSSWRTKHKFML